MKENELIRDIRIFFIPELYFFGNILTAIFSIIFSVFSGVMGLILSYYTNVATGPMIVIIASVIYFVTYFFGRKWKE